MKAAKLPFFLVLALLVYQNCGSFVVDETWSVYSYRKPAVFFYDVRLVSRELDNLNRENYILDFAVASVKAPEAEIEYIVAFSTPQMTGICPIKTGKVQGEGRHFRLACLLPHSDTLYIKLTLKGPGDEEVVAQIGF